MPSRETIDAFLAARHIAVVGVSRDSKQFPNAVYRRLREGGRTMYPVNGNADAQTIEGDHCYRTLADVPDPVDGVLVMVPADRSADIVSQAIARGIGKVWLHRGVGAGAMSAAAVALCRDHGVDVVDGACPLMFDEPVAGIHKLHRFVIHRRFAA